jgi:hypothetical protein
MHTVKTIAAILGLMFVTSACSSELDEAQPLSIGTSGSDAAFSFYDRDGDSVVSAKEIYKVEQGFGASRITSNSEAERVLGDYDFDNSRSLDNLEFTGLVHARVLVGVLSHPEWTQPK